MFGMQVPAAMLRQFYQVGSLRNGDEGIQFALTNPLMPATIVEILEVSVAGKPFELAEIDFAQEGVSREALSVTSDAPVAFQKGAVVRVSLRGVDLEPGLHSVMVKVKTGEFGIIQVEVEDTIGRQKGS